ncbi:RAD23 family protein [Plantactinospora sonchi]|uniref:Uncharacterized protein n=1 Tax=Plantactinospora sonchi TaxID=1544735 RepID=A0ABU7RM74_9ACTN
MRRSGVVLTAVLVVAMTLTGCARPSGVGTTAIPDEVLLTEADLGDGARITDGGPGAAHPLPPQPCTTPSPTGPSPTGPSAAGPSSTGPSAAGPSPTGSEGATATAPSASTPSSTRSAAGAIPAPAGPTAERTINAAVGRYHVYEYVARYPAGAAEAALTRLRDELDRCARPTADERWKVLAVDSAGLLVLRDYQDGARSSAYYLGHAGDFLLAVLVVGEATTDGDPTTASSLGSTALTRAGGSRGVVAPPATPSGPPTWSTIQADVTAVRPGPDPRTLLLDVDLPAGHPECARDPRITYYTEEPGPDRQPDRIHANVVVDSARSGMTGGCPSRVTGEVRLRAPKPIGDRLVVLNYEAWARQGAAYRRCDSTVGCTPPADHCDPTWVIAAVQGLDVPRNSARNTERCDGAWLVLTLDTNSTVCGAGGRPGCEAPPSVHRYFLHWQEGGWRTVTRTQDPGCGDVLARRPEFPRSLCQDLPATW